MKRVVLALMIYVHILPAQKLPFQFNAKGILVLSDADMVSSAYIDGQLKTEHGVNDALTVIKWDSSATEINKREIHISNSVTNWVDGLEVSNDGITVFVVDTKGALHRSIQIVDNVFTDLPNGNMMYAIDISDLSQPKLIDSIQVGSNPLSVDVNPENGQLLVVCREKDNEIQIIDWNGSKFTTIYKQSLNRGENVATHGSWHPSGDHFALTLEPSMEIGFYQYNSLNQISLVGNPIKVGSYPGAGKFSRSGNFYLVPDLKWDRGYDVNGALIAIEFSIAGNHSIRSEIEVGISPEGFAISPDGQLIAVSNMGTNFMPIDFLLFGNKASISLIAFDEIKGEFELHDTQIWEGILPEGIIFDAHGEMLAITSYDYLDLSDRKGGVSFWNIIKNDGRFQLQNTGFKISVVRGSHYVRIVE